MRLPPGRYARWPNEFVAVARRRFHRSGQEVRQALALLRVSCPEPVPLTVEIHERAVDIVARYGYSFFDSLVIAAALHAGAKNFTSRTCRMARRSTGLLLSIRCRAQSIFGACLIRDRLESHPRVGRGPHVFLARPRRLHISAGGGVRPTIRRARQGSPDRAASAFAFASFLLLCYGELEFSFYGVDAVEDDA